MAGRQAGRITHGMGEVVGSLSSLPEGDWITTIFLGKRKNINLEWKFSSLLKSPSIPFPIIPIITIPVGSDKVPPAKLELGIGGR